MAAKNKFALVLLIGGKWVVSYHPTEKAANDEALKHKEYEGGWVASGTDDLKDDLPASQLCSLLDHLTKKKPGSAKIKDEAKARDAVWTELFKHLPGAAAPAAPAAQAAPAAEEPASEEVTEETTAEETTTESTAETAGEGESQDQPAGEAGSVTTTETTMQTQTSSSTARRAPARAAGGKTKSAKTKAAAPAKTAAASKGNGHGRGMTDGWKKLIRALDKKGAEGATYDDIRAMCKTAGVKPYFARYVKSGDIKRVDRGVYAVTAQGRKNAA